ncbi:MAG: hypothetical protein JW991_02725 [Candidatus Pacebacteria bacterium]|nr:hypothetical protein [Candidatus Paceibacterota bacterium]
MISKERPTVIVRYGGQDETEQLQSALAKLGMRGISTDPGDSPRMRVYIPGKMGFLTLTSGLEQEIANLVNFEINFRLLE